MKTIFQLAILVLLVLGISCNQGQEKADTNKKPATSQQNNNDFVTTSTGRKVPKSEKGITVANPDGWEDKQMEFQQRYCESMMENIEGLEGWKFCECFLDKIQYYYKPIHFKEAYDDQQKWNSECYQEAQK